MSKPDEFAIEAYETYGIRDLARVHAEPSAFNGFVKVRRYRITVERVSTDDEERAAVQRLWEECDNYHHWQPLRDAAARLGFELVGSPGSKRRDRP